MCTFILGARLSLQSFQGRETCLVTFANNHAVSISDNNCN